MNDILFSKLKKDKTLKEFLNELESFSTNSDFNFVSGVFDNSEKENLLKRLNQYLKEHYNLETKRTEELLYELFS